MKNFSEKNFSYGISEVHFIARSMKKIKVNVVNQTSNGVDTKYSEC